MTKYLYCIDRSISEQDKGGATTLICVVEEEYFEMRGCLDSVDHEWMLDLGFPSFMEATYESYVSEEATHEVLRNAGLTESAELSTYINGKQT